MGKGFPIDPVDRGYHGMARPLRGEYIEPNAAGHKPVFGFSDQQSTYFTPAPSGMTADRQFSQESNGWRWAKSAAADYLATETHASRSGEKIAGRPVVHVTEPEGQQHIDKNMHGEREPGNEVKNWGERVAPRQRVVDTIWGPPPVPGGRGHTEMALPHNNWARYDLPNYKVHEYKPYDKTWDTTDDRGRWSLSYGAAHPEHDDSLPHHRQVSRNVARNRDQQQLPGMA